MENIKITSGKFRGQNIKSPNSKLTHPMGSREKLALFNMISEYLPGANVLDAYAGSGALGIEALSHGARKVIFIEKSPKVSKIIKENLANLGLKENVWVGDTSKFNTDDFFDIIIADPPYNDFGTDGVKNLINFLRKSGVLVLSHPEKAPEIEGLELRKTRQYASAHISVYALAE